MKKKGKSSVIFSMVSSFRVLKDKNCHVAFAFDVRILTCLRVGKMYGSNILS